jgi:hypothetical protein
MPVPSMLCTRFPLFGSLFAFLGLLCQFQVCAGIVVSVRLQLEKMGQDVGDSVYFRGFKSSANTLDSFHVGRQRGASRVVVI